MNCCKETNRRGSKATRKEKKRLPVRQRAAYGVGHILNDLTSSVSFTYFVIYFTKVAELSNRYTGFVILLGQIADAISNWTTGIFSDRTRSRYGRRKKWHLVGTVIVTIGFPLLLMRILDQNTSDLIKFMYFAVAISIFQFGWGCTQVSHLSLIPELSRHENERMALNVIRTTLTFVCGIYVFLVTWVLLGQSSERNITPNVWKEFMYLSFIILITGNLCNVIFHVIIKEPPSARIPKKRQEKQSASSSKKDENVLENSVPDSSTKTKLQWLKNPSFQKTAALYVCSRVVIRISQTYLAVYLTEALDFEKEATAYFPLVVLASCALSSSSVQLLSARLGRKITFIIGTFFSLGACAWFFFQTVKSRNAVYVATILIGSGGSTMLVTSLSLIADLIGNDKSSGAFVYGVCALTYKLTSGVVIAIIQEMNPREHSFEDGLERSRYIQLVYSIVPDSFAMIALITMTVGFDSKLDCKMRAEVVDAEVQADSDKEFIWIKQSTQDKVHRNTGTQMTADITLPEQNNTGDNGNHINKMMVETRV